VPQTCHNAFPDNTFYVYDGAPYCKRHYHRLNNSLCRSCDEPIEGPCVQTIEGWRYHPVCLSCSVCSFSFCSKAIVSYLISHHFFTSRSAASRSPMYTTFTKIELTAKRICFICSARGMFAQNVDKQCSKTCRYYSLFSKKNYCRPIFFPFFFFFNNSVFL
jgi:hypothetical protein